MLIGGAAQNLAVTTVAAQVFDVPVVVPAPSEYVADGAAVQAAWTLTGARPVGPLQIVDEPAPDHRVVIRDQYERYAGRLLESK
jgi:xylulokinase